MKEALDKQELKIQTSLVNNEDNIGNQAVQQNHHRNPLQTIYEEDSQVWQHENSPEIGEEVSDIWEFGSHHMHRDWLHH